MKKYIFTAILALAVCACATYKKAGTGISQDDLNRATQKYPGITMADLNQGKTAFEANCGKCHGLDKPFNVSDKALENVMPSMAGKANLDGKTSDLVLKYLMVMKNAPKKG